jgi:Protein of unknown function (DUF3572)
MAQVNRIDREAAEGLAVQALGYLAADPERLGRFLALSGLGPETIRAAAGDPRFLAGVLEYVAGDEALLVAFAAHAAVPPLMVEQARVLLSGQRWEGETP